MAGSGKKSLTPFYVVFGVVAAGGVLLIARGAMQSDPPLNLQTIAPVSTGPRGITIGADSAPVEVIEFSDFQCPFCAQFATLSMPDIQQRLLATGKVRWRFVHYPMEMHPNAPQAHLAGACANEQGRFWEMHDVIYQYQSQWSESRNPQNQMEDYARRIGLDMERYESCVSERRTWGPGCGREGLGRFAAGGAARRRSSSTVGSCPTCRRWTAWSRWPIRSRPPRRAAGPPPTRCVTGRSPRCWRWRDCCFRPTCCSSGWGSWARSSAARAAAA